MQEREERWSTRQRVYAILAILWAVEGVFLFTVHGPIAWAGFVVWILLTIVLLAMG